VTNASHNGWVVVALFSSATLEAPLLILGNGNPQKKSHEEPNNKKNG
jgi:hypothetical protein